jgi:hypothetical protein
MRCAVAATLALCALAAGSGAWARGDNQPSELSALPSTGRFDYEVIREGERIGSHSVVFRHEGHRLAIATRTDIAVEMLGITLFRFRYEAEEEWVDGQLSRLASRTDNDGERLAVDLARADGRLRGACNGMVLDLPADLLPISVWHPDFVRRSVIFDQYKCVTRRVRATDHGVESIFAGAQNVAARRYAVTGELRREIWYGPEGQTVRVLFPAKDGSEIAFVMRTPGQPSPAAEQRPAARLTKGPAIRDN